MKNRTSIFLGRDLMSDLAQASLLLRIGLCVSMT